MDPQAQELISTMQFLVQEMKKGEMAYQGILNKDPNMAFERRQKFEGFMKKMHQASAKLNIGIEGLKEIEMLKNELNQFGQQGY